MSLLREVAIFLCAMLVVSEAQVMSLGSCPNVTVMQNFQADKYLGKWYEYEKYFAVFELGGKCITAHYSDLGDGVIGVLNKQINTLKNNIRDSINGTARLVNPPEAKLEVVFPQSPFPAPYWVLDTDYTSYAVVWGCSDLLAFNLSFAWVLTREQHPSKTVLEKAYVAIDKNKIKRDPFQKTDQRNCPNDL